LRRFFARNWRHLPWVVVLAVLSACIPPSVLQYTAFHEDQFPPAEKPAEFNKKSTAELLRGGYLLIGYIDLRRNIRTCYTDGTCEKHAEPGLSSEQLQLEAAKRGGEIISLLDERNLSEQRNKSICNSYTTRTITVNKKTQTITTCTSYRTVHGKLEATVSRALIWRHDPLKAGGEANARAIESALATIEAVYQTEEKKGAGASAGTARVVVPSERIYAAIKNEDLAALDALARDGTLESWTDDEGRTALMLALAVKRFKAARKLLSIDPGIYRVAHDGGTTLHYAAGSADLQFVMQLVQAGHDLHVKDYEGASVLFWALHNKNTAVFNWLIAKGVDPKTPTLSERTTLMYAAELGHEAHVRHLLKLGMPPNARDRRGITAFMGAARGGQVAMLKLLMSKGAVPTLADDDGDTALHYAAHKGKREALQVLLDKRVDVNEANKTGITPLFVAIAAGQWDAANYLIQRGAALTTKAIGVSTAVSLVISKDSAQMLRRYIAAFPTLKEELKRDSSWFHYAARSSGRETLQLLLDLGAGPNSLGKDGLTPLMVAASAGNANAVRFLLEQKVDVAVEHQGRTAWGMARAANQDKVVAVFAEFGVIE
jgi:uncharacterized protein